MMNQGFLVNFIHSGNGEANNQISNNNADYHSESNKQQLNCPIDVYIFNIAYKLINLKYSTKAILEKGARHFLLNEKKLNG